MRVSERDLERLAPRLGDGAAARLDVDAVAAGVTRRLRAAGDGGRPHPAGRWLALAAGLVLAVGAGWVTFSGSRLQPVLGSAPVLTPGLGVLSAAELTVVLDSLNEESVVSVASSPTLEDLDAEQLAELLTMLEG